MRQTGQTPGQDWGPEARTSPLRVLLVAGNGLSAQLLEEVGRYTPLQIQRARGARDAWMELRERIFDVVVIELAPGPLGPAELYHGMVQLFPELKDRVIFLAHDLGHPEARRFLREAGCPFLTPPLDPGALRDLVFRVGGDRRR